MAAKTAVKTTHIPAPKVAETPAAVSWDDLPAPEVATYVRSGGGKSRVDVEADTPVVIKDRVVAAHTAHCAAVAAGGKPVYFWQTCKSREQAELFVKLAKRYTRFREWTFRGGVDKDETSNQVTFNVRPKETRVKADKAA